MPTYYLMAGIPGSGKSTYADSLGCWVVFPDTIRETHRVSSPEAFEIARREVAALLLDGQDVVFDATNTTSNGPVAPVAKRGGCAGGKEMAQNAQNDEDEDTDDDATEGGDAVDDDEDTGDENANGGGKSGHEEVDDENDSEDIEIAEPRLSPKSAERHRLVEQLEHM